MAKTVFITGTSSGIGLVSARLFFEKGWNVVATMRSPAKHTELKSHDPTRVLIVRLDLQDPRSITAAINAAVTKFQKIDLLLNNAGFGEAGVFEGISPEQIKAQFDVNLFGLMDVTRAILPHFRANNGGGIINTSSGAGFYAIPMLSIYNATKFALEGFTEALAFELQSQNVFVKNVIPHGAVKSTDFNFELKSVVDDAVETPASYLPFVQKTTEALSQTFAMRSLTAQGVAEVVFEAATDGTKKLRYPVFGVDMVKFADARFKSKSDEEYVESMRSFFP